MKNFLSPLWLNKQTKIITLDCKPVHVPVIAGPASLPCLVSLFGAVIVTTCSLLNYRPLFPPASRFQATFSGADPRSPSQLCVYRLFCLVAVCPCSDRRIPAWATHLAQCYWAPFFFPPSSSSSFIPASLLSDPLFRCARHTTSHDTPVTFTPVHAYPRPKRSSGGWKCYI